MTLNERIAALVRLGEQIIDPDDPRYEGPIHLAYQKNQWFTPKNCKKSLVAIAQHFLNKRKLHDWITHYQLTETSPKVVAIVMAGNIPMVGFHDLLCSFIVGHKTLYKCSSKDEILIPFLIEELVAIDPRVAGYFEKVDRLTSFDAVIATGGDTAATHFEYYFKKYPSVIRHNRNSVAVLSGHETRDEIELLGGDIFDYFGLGCRSVSKLYVPRDYHFDHFFEGIFSYADLISHNAYKNNFDYSYALYTLNLQPFLTNNVLIIREDSALSGRISCVHYEYYDDLTSLQLALAEQSDRIQCISSNLELEMLSGKVVPLGCCQRPGLMDYADDIDVVDFLTTAL